MVAIEDDDIDEPIVLLQEESGITKTSTSKILVKEMNLDLYRLELEFIVRK
ncbi:MAG: hypothetical protein ACE5RJ_06075 [Nitrosopumilaceae archaeon]